MQDIVRFHHEQSAPDTCVAACICMILRLRGESAEESAIHSEHPGLSLVLAMRDAHHVSAYDVEELRVSLGTDEVVAITVHGPPYVKWQESAYPDLVSGHGRMCAPADFGGPLHAVLLVGCDEDGFFLLDPYFASHGQPLYMTQRALLRCFSGHAVAAAIT